MQQPIKTGILSFGMSGKIFHAPFLDENSNFQFYAVLERTEKKAQLLYSNIISYNKIEELLRDPEIELVIVNTPNTTHFEYAMQALNAGKHVLMEKPFTITSSEAADLFRRAEEMKLYILPYQNRRYDSDFVSVKEIVEAGSLGKLVEAHFRFDRYRYEIGPKAAKESGKPGSGILYDLGPHLLDQVIFIFGIPLKWRKTLGKFRPNTKVDDFAHIHLEYPEYLQVFITISMLVAEPQSAFIINGTKGSYTKLRADVQEKQLVDGMKPSDSNYGIETSDDAGRLTVMSKDGKLQSETMEASKSSYGNVFKDVYNTIRNGMSYPVSEKQILKQLEILES